ncbi:MAG: lytic transglycosylase domain-containing protein [Bacteroidia bacterium]|nr:lytic transglycosylase domain-containing protein [Bacteroidia bacterium]
MQKQQTILKRGLQLLGVIGFVLIMIAIAQSFIGKAEGISNQHLTSPVDDRFEVQKVFAPELPTDVNFCGEVIDLSDIEISERLDRELVVNSFLHSSTILILKKSNRYFPIIEKILLQEGVPDDMKYLCVAESGLSQVVSPAGAAGFWQFMKTTAPAYSLYIDNEIDERYNIEKATYAACKYLKEAKAKFGSWSLAAAAYNAGNNGIMKQINFQNQTSYYDLFLNEETSRYIFRIIALKYIIENPKLYGFHLKDEQLYAPLEVRRYTVSQNNIDWVEYANRNDISYKTLRYYNPQIRSSTWANIKNQQIEILLPK